MRTEFTLVDALVLFAALPLWLLVGHICIHRTPNLVRYSWGTVGGGAVGLGLMIYHGAVQLVWLPVLGVSAGLGATALIYLADGLRNIYRYHRGGGVVFSRDFLDRLRAVWHHRAGPL